MKWQYDFFTADKHFFLYQTGIAAPAEPFYRLRVRQARNDQTKKCESATPACFALR
jgi:hypothetical protein